METGIEKPEVVKTDYVIDYTRLNIDQRVLVKSEQDGYDFFYTYGLDKLQVMTIGEGSNWWGQSIKKCVNMAYVHTDRLGSVVNLSDQYGRVTARADYTDWGEVRRYTDITVDGGFRRLLPEITYATHEYDDVLNQFYAKARMYDAENKRFDAVDPILDPARYEIGLYVLNPAMLVQQVYAFDAPYTYIDPLGLMNYFTQTDDLLSGVAQGIKDNTIGLIESIPQTISMVKELAVGAVKGEIDLLTLAKTVLEGAFGDYYHVARYIDTLDPFVSKTDAQVYRYGRAVGSVATDVALALVGATVVDKVADILQSSKAGQKILNLAKKAQGYFEDLTCKNKQQLSTTLYQLTDESSNVQRNLARTYADTKNLPKLTTSSSKQFVDWLNKGESNNVVYFGIQDSADAVYTGITRQSPKIRLQQHNHNGKSFSDLAVQYKDLTRNQARALEQYYIEHGPNALNKINSISPNATYYKEAMQWAENYINGYGR